jgi:hypothetical protein
MRLDETERLTDYSVCSQLRRDIAAPLVLLCHKTFVRLNNLCVRVEIMTLPSDSVPRGDNAPYRTSISVSCADPSNRVLFVFLGAPLY